MGGQALAFYGTVFGEGFAVATTPQGATLRFTRQERAVLARLAANPGRVFSRAELYEVTGSTGSDRNVDFVINRLRSKLAGAGSGRRFIATQYGEGYVWVALADGRTADSAFLVIGPVRGEPEAVGSTRLQALAEALRARLTPGSGVVLAPSPTAEVLAAATFTLEVRLHPLAGRTHAAFVLRRGMQGAACATFRETFTSGDELSLPALVEAITDALWRGLALRPGGPPTPIDPPMHLRLRDASALLDPPGVTWLTNGAHLARLREAHPDDALVEMMWAMHLFACITLAPGPEPLNRARVRAVDDEIEAIVRRCLPAARRDPILALAAAKLLLLRQDSRTELAESLALKAFTGSAAFAAALPMMGQVHAYRGEFAEAQDLYDESLALGEPSGTFERYILTLKAMAFLAAGDHAAAGATFERLVRLDASVLEAMGLLFLPPSDDGLARRLAPIVDRIDLAEARRMISHFWFRVGDLFRASDHRANVMVGSLTHLVRRFGPEVASDEIWAELPEELSYLRRPPRDARAWSYVGPGPSKEPMRRLQGALRDR